MAALHPHFSSASQAVRKGRTKWQEALGSELWPFVSEMETFPRDLVYASWPEKHLMASIAIWVGERAPRNKIFLLSSLYCSLTPGRMGVGRASEDVLCLLVARAGIHFL